MKDLLFALTVIAFTIGSQSITTKVKGNAEELAFRRVPFQLTGQSAADTVTIDVTNVIGPATQRASGFFFGFQGNVIPDSLLLPLKPRLLRTGIINIMATYDRCKAIGCAMELTLNWGSKWRGGLPGDNGDWTKWENFVTSVTKQVISRNMMDVRFGLWSDVDNKNSFRWPVEVYLEAFKRGYNIIRCLHPQAIIVGPNSEWGPNNAYWWNDHKDDNTFFIRLFIDYCQANNCMPDIIALHDHANNGIGIERDAAAVRDCLKAKNISGVEFEEDDTGPIAEQFKPGTFVSIFAGSERGKVFATAKCCWDNDCGNNTLEGLLTKNDRQPRSLWWTYKNYADITGNIIMVKRSSSVDGVAGIDNTGNPVIRAILGRYSSSTTPVVVLFRNLPSEIKSIQVLGKSIPDSERNALENPSITINRVFRPIGGELKISLTDIGPYEAYFLTLISQGSNNCSSVPSSEYLLPAE